jgi:predicted acetyltransferase
VNLEYGAPRCEETQQLVELLEWSFHLPEDRARLWIERAGIDHFRVVRDGGQLIACLLVERTGQFYWGRRVPAAAIAAVATRAEHRGAGAASALLLETLRELVATGSSIALLYPSTRTLYRSVGFEPAGMRYTYQVATGSLRRGERPLLIRTIEPEDEPEIERLYLAGAVQWNGPLERNPYFWERIRRNPLHSVRGFVVGERGHGQGYVYLYEKPGARGSYQYEISVVDVAATTEAAMRRILAFLADHGSMATYAEWPGGPSDQLIQLLPEATYTASLSISHWMVRLVDVASALSHRGYPPGIKAELHLSVKDELLPRNDACFVLEVADGRGKVFPGGEGRLSVGVRGFAPLFTGHQPPVALASLGMLDGPEAELARASAVFAGPAPWMREVF